MYGGPPPPQYAAYPPQYYPPQPHYRKKSSGGSCCRCICCCCCLIFLIILIQLISVFYFYHVFDPKIPSYRVESFVVKAIDLKPDSTLTTDLQVAIKAVNPNKNIGFNYGDDSWITVGYSDANLCVGKLPAFEQGHENTTVITVNLIGKTVFGPDLQKKFTEDQNNHWIPMLVKFKVPVNVVLGEITLREMKVFVNCSLVLDSLTPNKSAQILSMENMFKIEIS